MKKYFLTAMVMVLILSVALIGYGIFINYKGENVIIDRMNNQAISVHVSKVGYRDINPYYEVANAALEPTNATDVIAKVDGIISEQLLFKNKQVHAGDVLAVLTNGDMPLRIKQAESALKKAQAIEIQAHNSYNRYARLAQLDATSLEKLDETKANFEAAQAAVADAEASYQQALLNQQRLNIVSNADGAVLVIYKQQGSYVSAGTPICLVGDFSKLWFAIDIDDVELRALLGPDNDIAPLQLSFKRPNFIKSYNTEYGVGNKGVHSVFDLDIQGIYPTLDQPADTRRIVFYVNNPTQVLEARNYEDLIITNQHSRHLLCVPYTSLFDDSNDDSAAYNVYVVNANNILEQRTVTVGAFSDDYAEVIDGVNEGELVVTFGWESLEAGQKVAIETEDE